MPSSPRGSTHTTQQQLLASLILEPGLKKPTATTVPLPRSRLSPFLPQRSGGLLGRPRGTPTVVNNAAGLDTSAPSRRKILDSATDVKPLPTHRGPTSDAVSVIPPPASLPRITVAEPGGPTSPSSSFPSELGGLSSLTITSDSENRSLATSTQSPNLSPSLPLAGVTVTVQPPVEPVPVVAEAPAADWRAAFRVPLLNRDGHLVGYRQNSSMLRRQMEVSIPSDLEGTTPPESPLFLYGTTPTFASADEFAVAASDPHGGFPDAENRVPGYLLGPIVGRGGFSTVRKALHVATGLPVAVKVIEKCRMLDPKDRDRVDREIRVMRQLSGHIGIARLLEFSETPQYLYLIMEYCAGGSLLDYVRSRRRLTENEALGLFQQLLAAVQHCHRRGVVHRDIKLENILLDGRGGLRLIDFGLCGYFVPDKCLRCHCGSPSYAAPEIVARREYIATPVDVWSAGVVLYAMLAGYLPFQAKEKKALSQKIMIAAWKPPAGVSDQALDLLRSMLTQDPTQRIALDAIWKHPWVVNGPQWEGRGEGPGGLLRSPVDPVTGAQIPDPEVVVVWTHAMGPRADVAALMRGLRHRECNTLTAAYHLLNEAKVAAREVTENANNSARNDAALIKGKSGTWARASESDTSSSGEGGSTSARSSDTADLEVFV